MTWSLPKVHLVRKKKMVWPTQSRCLCKQPWLSRDWTHCDSRHPPPAKQMQVESGSYILPTQATQGIQNFYISFFSFSIQQSMDRKLQQWQSPNYTSIQWKKTTTRKFNSIFQFSTIDFSWKIELMVIRQCIFSCCPPLVNAGPVVKLTVFEYLIPNVSFLQTS